VPSQASSTDSQTTHPGLASQEKAFRAGRFSLVIDTEPVQSFTASFELAGGWPDGVLTIYNPLGMQMARVEWTPQGARLIQGSQIREAVSLESLIFQLTGTQLPAAALVDWLGGKPTPAEGWKVDVSEWHLRRLVLERIQPSPRTVLRIAFDS
jgi:outer membrane lipoprotein LolB